VTFTSRRRLVVAGLPIVFLLVGVCAAAQDHDQTAGTTRTHQHRQSADDTLFPPRDGSGTSWFPDDTPMHGVMHPWREWTIAIHGTRLPLAWHGGFQETPGPVRRLGRSHDACGLEPRDPRDPRLVKPASIRAYDAHNADNFANTSDPDGTAG
jgi:hypothetical protein